MFEASKITTVTVDQVMASNSIGRAQYRRQIGSEIISGSPSKDLQR